MHERWFKIPVLQTEREWDGACVPPVCSSCQTDVAKTDRDEKHLSQRTCCAIATPSLPSHCRDALSTAKEYRRSPLLYHCYMERGLFASHLDLTEPRLTANSPWVFCSWWEKWTSVLTLSIIMWRSAIKPCYSVLGWAHVQLQQSCFIDGNIFPLFMCEYCRKSSGWICLWGLKQPGLLSWHRGG